MVTRLRAASLRIALVVDPEAPVANSLAALLCGEGFHVLTLNEIPAFAEVRRLRPELIVIGRPDLESSWADDFISSVKHDPITAETPMLVLDKDLRNVQRNATRILAMLHETSPNPETSTQKSELATTYLD